MEVPGKPWRWKRNSPASRMDWAVCRTAVSPDPSEPTILSIERTTVHQDHTPLTGVSQPSLANEIARGSTRAIVKSNTYLYGGLLFPVTNQGDLAKQPHDQHPNPDPLPWIQLGPRSSLLRPPDEQIGAGQAGHRPNQGSDRQRFRFPCLVTVHVSTLIRTGKWISRNARARPALQLTPPGRRSAARQRHCRGGPPPPAAQRHPARRWSAAAPPGSGEASGRSQLRGPPSARPVGRRRAWPAEPEPC